MAGEADIRSLRHRIKPAGPIATAILNHFGFAAIVSPWRTIYVLPEWISDPSIRAHEKAHIAQIARDGFWYFWPKIILDFYRLEYEHSPYEIKAREIERRYRPTGAESP